MKTSAGEDALKDRITPRLMKRLYTGPLLQNDARGAYVEEMIALALEPEWFFASSDWSGWDFDNGDKVRIQVKQSAARQSWAGNPYAGQFSIKAVTGYWEDGTRWVPCPGRAADLYVFAWHPVADERADHTDPSQWRFYLSLERQLSEGQKTIAPSTLERLTTRIGYEELRAAVEQLVAALRPDELKVARTSVPRRTLRRR